MSPSADSNSSQSLPLWQCRRRLATLWFVAAGAFFVALLVITMFFDNGSGRGAAGGRVDKELWNWLLPAFVPSLSLMVGVLVARLGADANDEGSRVDRFLFRLAFWISVVYLAAFGLAFVNATLLSDSARKVIRESNLWLGPVQGLVTGSLGAFFVHSQAQASSASTTSAVQGGGRQRMRGRTAG